MRTHARMLGYVAALIVAVGVIWAGYWVVWGVSSAVSALQGPAGYSQTSISEMQWEFFRFFIQAAAANALYGTLMIIGGVVMVRWSIRVQREQYKASDVATGIGIKYD